MKYSSGIFVKVSLHLKTWSQNLTDAVPGGKNCVNCLEKTHWRKKNGAKSVGKNCGNPLEKHTKLSGNLDKSSHKKKLLNTYAAQLNPKTNKEFLS